MIEYHGSKLDASKIPLFLNISFGTLLHMTILYRLLKNKMEFKKYKYLLIAQSALNCAIPIASILYFLVRTSFIFEKSEFRSQ